MKTPPRVGDRLLARLYDGRTWDGHCVRFSEKESGRWHVERELILSLDPARNPKLGKPNAGRAIGEDGLPVPRWHRKLTATVRIGTEYHVGWDYMIAAPGQTIVELELRP